MIAKGFTPEYGAKVFAIMEISRQRLSRNTSRIVRPVDQSRSGCRT